MFIVVYPPNRYVESFMEGKIEYTMYPHKAFKFTKAEVVAFLKFAGIPELTYRGAY